MLAALSEQVPLLREVRQVKKVAPLA